MKCGQHIDRKTDATAF